jgi:hypothetical protein
VTRAPSDCAWSGINGAVMTVSTSGMRRMSASACQQVLEELDRAWLSTLAKPEHRSLADFEIRIASCDVDQLVDRDVIAAL